MAVFFYNGTVKDKEQTQDIADLTAKVESLENQQDQLQTSNNKRRTKVKARNKINSTRSNKNKERKLKTRD